ncbi:MAG: response regulator [Lachnospiraceae bacterium]|nr:response regulator [Lachnospiraceae bacterium]
MSEKDIKKEHSVNKEDRSVYTIFVAVAISFVLAIIVSIYSLTMLARENTKELDKMLAYRIYDSISGSLNEPITVSQTMACNEFLVDFLENEDSMDEDEAIEVMQRYLKSVKEGLDYDSAFVVSEKSRRYYTYEGLNKIVDPENDEHDIWYSLFIDKDVPLDLDVDNDEVNRGLWTVFVNTRLEDEEGNLLGVCGVGVQMTNLQEMFREAEEEYNVRINLIDENGLIQVDVDDINIEKARLDISMTGNKESDEYVYHTKDSDEFVITKYVEYLDWYLVVRSAPATISRDFANIIVINIILFLLVFGILVFAIAAILRRSRKARDDRERLLIVSERALAASDAKSSFLSSMSHEIRTPINTVLGMNEMILRESDDRKILDYSVSIKNAGKTLLTLINSILDFSKIEEGKMEIVPVKYDTKTLINNIVASVYERANDKGLEFITEVDPNLPSQMKGDDVRILQVVMNILTNAVKYTDKGHVRLIFREEKREGKDIDLFVSVEDTGIGIRKEDMSKLFESFERLDEVKNHSIEGTGLGMSIVTNLLRLMDSEIHVESEYGSGSVFYFVIRQQIEDETPIGDHLSDSYESIRENTKIALRAEGAKVLVVDDNTMNLKVAYNLLGLFGIKAELSNSGYDAIECVKKDRYDLILLDHMMPKMDGKETLDKMRAENLLSGDTKVIALTANAINGAKEEYLESGFDDYLSKPIELKELEDILRRWLPEEYLKAADNDSDRPDRGEVKTEKNREFEGDRNINSDKDGNKEYDGSKNDEAILTGLKNAGFDVTEALSYCAEDPGFYKEILNEYAGLYEETKQELDEFYKAEDWVEFKVRVHALKSLSKTIGKTGIYEKARAMEKAAGSEDSEFIRQNYDEFMDDYEKSVKSINECLGSEI